MTKEKILENKPKYYSIFNRKRKEERESSKSRQRSDKMFSTTTSFKSLKREGLSRLKVNPLQAADTDSIFSFKNIDI